MTSDNLYDFSKLLKLTKAMEDILSCSNCQQSYNKKWCKDNKCFFCKNYLPMRDTITSILRDIDWMYLKSGEISRVEYYNDFLDNLEKWSMRFSVLPTKHDLKTIEELRNIKDWTREYWH